MSNRTTWPGILVLGTFVAAAGGLVPACGDDTEDFGPPLPAGDDCRRNGQECPALCDATLGCVDCLSDADCGAAEPACVAGQCEECGDNLDCAAGEACFPREHRCRPACSTASDCPSDEAPLCDPDTGACVGCIDAQDCGASDPICSPVTQQCSECASSEDCSAAEPVCDVADGRCRECLVDGDCPASEPLCADHECRPGCSSDDDCGGERPVCNLETHHCVQCLDAQDCPVSEPLCTVRHRCAQCETNEHCTDPDLGVCSDGECVECAVSGDCPTGYSCRDNQCEPSGPG